MTQNETPESVPDFSDLKALQAGGFAPTDEQKEQAMRIAVGQIYIQAQCALPKMTFKESLLATVSRGAIQTFFHSTPYPVAAQESA